eukprot:1659817-Prymnesium_polylepis.1
MAADLGERLSLHTALVTAVEQGRWADAARAGAQASSDPSAGETLPHAPADLAHSAVRCSQESSVAGARTRVGAAQS